MHCVDVYKIASSGCFNCAELYCNSCVCSGESRNYIIELSVRYGQLHLVKYFHQRSDIRSSYILQFAVGCGQLNIVKYLLQIGCAAPKICLSCVAANYKQTHIIDYFKEQGKTLCTCAYYNAIVNNEFDKIVYLCQNNYPLDHSVSELAIRRGNLSILKYVYKNGCQIDRGLFRMAGKNNDDYSKYLRKISFKEARRVSRFIPMDVWKIIGCMILYK